MKARSKKERSSRPGSTFSIRDRGTETGDTLLEVLIALVIIGICVVALLGVLTTSITSSAEYRSLVSVDTVLKNFADALRYDADLQPQQPSSFFQQCATSYQVVSEYPTSAVIGSGVTVFGTDFTHISPSSVWKVTLTAPSVPTVVITSFSNNGPTITSTNNVTATFNVQTNPAQYIAPGAYTLVLTDSTGDSVTSPTLLTVKPTIGPLNPASGPSPTSVTTTVSDFKPSSALTVTVGGVSVTPSPPITDANGNATISFVVPALPQGPQTITVSDTGSNSSSTTFTVSSQPGGIGAPALPPGSAVASSTVQITSISYWDNATSTFDTSCGNDDDSGIQLVTLQATGARGVADTLQVVLTDPMDQAPTGPTISVTSSTSLPPGTPPEPGVPITLTASLDPGSSPSCNTLVSPAVCYPTGTVGWVFTSSTGISPQPCSSTLISPPALGNGNVSTTTCILSTSQVAAGTYQVALNYSGDADYGPSNGLASVTVPVLTPTILVTSVTSGTKLTFTAAVSGPTGATQPTGAVTWTFSSSSPGNPTCPSAQVKNDAATCTVNPFLPGTYTVTANYAGDQNYFAASSSYSNASITNVMLVNGPSGTAGLIEPNDSIVVTYSGPIGLGALCSGWTGNALTDGVVKLINGGGNVSDSMTIASAGSCNGGGNFGSIKLSSPNYVATHNVTFSNSSITWNPFTNTLTITFGAESGNGTTQQVGPPGSAPIYTAGFTIGGSPFTIQSGVQF